MKASVIFCVLLAAILSVRAPSVPPSSETVTITTTPITVLDITSTAMITTTMATPYTAQETSPNTTANMISGTVTYNEILTRTQDMPSTIHSITYTETLPVTTPDTTYIPSSLSTTSPTTPPNPPTLTPPSPRLIMCPDGWDVFQGRCYYFVNQRMTWPQAQSNCAMLESMLVSAHSAQEYGFLQQLTNNNGNQNAWLGGFYLQDQWLWIDGSWFINSSLIMDNPPVTNPCLVLNMDQGWTNSPCNIPWYSSICVKNSNVPQAVMCPEGWTGFQGRCYFYNYESLSWPEADANCAGLQASLVSVHSNQEYFFLSQQATAANGSYPTWLGGFYLEDQWLWLDASWFYEGFFVDQSPDSTYPCLSIYSADGWSNYNCNQDLPSFCVKNAVV